MFNREHFIEIHSLMGEWRKKNGIPMSSQLGGYKNNTEEELGELKRAICTADIDEYIDAVCDVLVFTFNAFSLPEEQKDIYAQPIWLKEMKLSFKPDGFREVELLSRWRDMFWQDISEEESRHRAYISAIHMWILAGMMLSAKGVDLYLAMKETYKEISSRTGEWSDERQKWLKYKTPEAKALWVEANYNDCFVDGLADKFLDDLKNYKNQERSGWMLS